MYTIYNILILIIKKKENPLLSLVVATVKRLVHIISLE